MKLAEKDFHCSSILKLPMTVLWGFPFSQQYLCFGLISPLHFLSGQGSKGNATRADETGDGWGPGDLRHGKAVVPRE